MPQQVSNQETSMYSKIEVALNDAKDHWPTRNKSHKAGL